MQVQSRDKESSEYNSEEWQAGNPWRLPKMRDKGIPHWQILISASP